MISNKFITQSLMVVLAGFAVSSLSSCSASHNARLGIDPSSEVSAAPQLQTSFGSAQALKLMPKATLSSDSAVASNVTGNRSNRSSDSEADLDEVVINKSALEKEFLLFGNMIPQTQEPTSHGMKGRVVAFRRSGNSVFMLEATQGHVVSTSLPATLILANFPIIAETADSLVIDFNRGMNEAFVDGDWYAFDEGGNTYVDSTASERIHTSFISSVAQVGNALEVRQIAQIPEQAASQLQIQTGSNSPSKDPAKPQSLSLQLVPGQTNLNSYEFRYYIEPYHPNPNYSPRESSDFSRVGFFTVNPQVEASSGRTTTRITTWDLSKPVVYAVSANTPKEFHDAVKEGALYWNKVFGKEVVQVIDAPAGVTAPDPQYNVIQWVEDDSAGFAYADGLADPRSGELLHAQIFMTSVFGVEGALRMPKLLREMPQSATGTSGQFRPSFMQSSELCDRPFDQTITQAVTQLRSKGVTAPAVYLKAGQDYVRSTVAHEVGHTLGLRHNFAGSLASTASPDEVDKMFNDYILNGTIPSGQYFSSSIMEYNVFVEDVLHSSMMKQQQLVLPYDKIAMQWGYFGTPIDDSNTPIFCTDTQEAKFLDCITFDQGAKPIVANMMANRKAMNLLPASLVEKYILAKSPTDPRDVKPLQSLALDPVAITKTLTDVIKTQISWLDKLEKTPSIRTHRLFPFDTDFYKDDMDSAQTDFIASQVAEAGGIRSVLFQLVLPQDATADSKGHLMEELADAGLDAYLARADVRSGIGWDGKTQYTLTDADVALISANGKKLFGEIQKNAFEATIELIAQGSYKNPKIAPEVEAGIESLAEFVILAQTKTVVDGSPVTTPATSTSSHAASARVTEMITSMLNSHGSMGSAGSGSGGSPTHSAAATPPELKPSLPAYVFAFPLELRQKAATILAASLGNRSDWEAQAREKIGKNMLMNIALVTGEIDPTKIDPSKFKPAMQTWLQDQVEVISTIGQAGSH